MLLISIYHVLYTKTEYHGLILLCFLVNNTEFWTREKGSIPMQTTMNLYTFAPRWQRALILLVALSIATVSGEHHYVRPTSSSTTTACSQSASCHTLQEMLQHSSHYFLSHTTITFQSGYHKVNYSYNVLIRNARNITLLGDVRDHSVIQCTGGFGISFMKVTNLTISNLDFHLCGAPIPE